MSGALGANKKPKGNALTMSGGLGSSRSGEAKNKQKNYEKQHGDYDRRGGGRDRGRGSRGGRGGHGKRVNDDERGNTGREGGRRGRAGAAFDRLVSRDKDAFESPRTRLSRGYDDDPRRGSLAGRRGGRESSRGDRGGRGWRFSGSRRDRDEMAEEEQRISPPGRGRGRAGRGFAGESANKRMRVENGEEEAAYHDDSYDHDYGYYPSHRGGFRGRGRVVGSRGIRGRGRGGRFMGRGDPNDGNIAAREGEVAQDVTAEKNGADLSAAEAAEFHPSPMVAANYGYSASFRGRFRGRGLRGRGRVASMIAAKTWVRSKEGDDPKETGAVGGEQGASGGSAQDTGGGDS